jgi:hypothetical protein
MENNLLASALRDAAPTAGAVGAALYTYQKKSSILWATAAAFASFLAVNYLRQKVLAVLLDPPVDLPLTPAELPASTRAPATLNSVTDPLPPGAIEVQDKIGNVLSIEQHKARKPGAPDFSGGMRP